MRLDARVVEKTSKKGNTFFCVEVSLTPAIKKLVFLTQAELELIKLTYDEIED